MIVNKEDNKDILDLFQVELEGAKIKISLKNGSTLALTPKVEEGEVSDYYMEYLTGKENKKILKLKEKMKELESQINGIKYNSTEGSEDEADSEYEYEEELVAEETETEEESTESYMGEMPF